MITARSGVIPEHWPNRERASHLDSRSAVGRSKAFRAARLWSFSAGDTPDVHVLHFKYEEEGDGTDDGQIGHAYLLADDGSTGEEGRDLGWMTLATARAVARDYGASLDVDGPARWQGRGISIARKLFRS